MKSRHYLETICNELFLYDFRPLTSQYSRSGYLSEKTENVKYPDRIDTLLLRTVRNMLWIGALKGPRDAYLVTFDKRALPSSA